MSWVMVDNELGDGWWVGWWLIISWVMV